MIGDGERAAVVRQGDAVGAANALRGRRTADLARPGRRAVVRDRGGAVRDPDARHPPRPGLGDEGEAVGSHGQVVGLDSFGEGLHVTRGGIDRDHTLLPPLAAVEPSVGSELEAADRLAADGRAGAVGRRDPHHLRCLHVAIEEVALRVGAGSVREAEASGDDLP